VGEGSRDAVRSLQKRERPAIRINAQFTALLLGEWIEGITFIFPGAGREWEGLDGTRKWETGGESGVKGFGSQKA